MGGWGWGCSQGRGKALPIHMLGVFKNKEMSVSHHQRHVLLTLIIIPVVSIRLKNDGLRFRMPPPRPTMIN